MIEKAINRILELAQPNTITVAGDTYVDKKLHRIQQEQRASAPLETASLDSLIDYVKSGRDLKRHQPEDYIVQIVSPVRVELLSRLDADRERETLMICRAEVPSFPFGKYIDQETMVIGLQSMFEADDVGDMKTDRDLLLQFAGTVAAESVTEYGDDGVTQKATIKTGVVSKSEAIVPSPCYLRPRRTFIEVEQPASKFIFRMKNDGADVYSAIIEADGGAWKIDARMNILAYLEEQLDDTGVLILA